MLKALGFYFLIYGTYATFYKFEYSYLTWSYGQSLKNGANVYNSFSKDDVENQQEATINKMNHSRGSTDKEEEEVVMDLKAKMLI